MKNLKINISIIILLLINFIFFYKYSSRYTESGIYISILLFVFQFCIYLFGNKFILLTHIKNIICYSIIGLIAGLVIISHFMIPVESLNVDRWSAISSFITEACNGNYPYYAKSHLGNYPGPMPVYFLIASPFYLIGELSVLSCLGYIIIVILMVKKTRLTQNLVFLLFFLPTSLYMVWEIFTRSDILTFTTLVLLILDSSTRLKNLNKVKSIILAISTGLLLSTRSVYILPYIVFFLSSLINNEITSKKLFCFISISFIAFVSSFIPFIIIFNSDFFVMNPFIIQSSFLIPRFYIFIIILVSVLLTFLVKNNTDKFFYSGLSLFIAILIYSVYHLINSGYEGSFINSKIDISYFIFCIPFFIKYLADYKADETLKHRNDGVMEPRNLSLPEASEGDELASGW